MGYVVTEDGRWVNADVMRVAQIINEYDPNLRLVWIEPENRTVHDDKPYAVVGTDGQGREYFVMRLSEAEMDHRVLERLWTQDNGNGDVLAALDAKNAALKAIELKKEIERQEEARELAAWMIKAPVGARHNGVRLT